MLNFLVGINKNNYPHSRAQFKGATLLLFWFRMSIFLATRWFLALSLCKYYRTFDEKYIKADIRRRPVSFACYQWQTEPSTATKIHPLIVHGLNNGLVTFKSHRQQ